MMRLVTDNKTLPDVNYLVVGLGLSGAASAHFFLAGGYRCRVYDSSDAPTCLSSLEQRFPALEFFSGDLGFDLVDWADVLVISPGISLRQPPFERARAQGKILVGDVELFAQLAEGPIVAITGSNGKSTVTSLVGEVTKAAGLAVGVGGNIGTPVLDLLGRETNCYVLELSSYQLETLESLQPKVAALLNLCEDHLDRYDSYRDYIDTKRRIFRNAEICFSNADDKATICADSDVRFSLTPDSNVAFHLMEDNGYWLAHQSDPWLKVDALSITGRHNWANCLAAMAITHSLGIDRDTIVKAICGFAGIAHRSQWVDEIDGVEWINDSKATNVGAAQASIDGRDRPVILIAGGQSKGADMSHMVDSLRRRVKLVLLLGEDAGRLQQAWKAATRVQRVSDMREAVERANAAAVSGDCVLLAPACASFDMYEKFEARGEDFMQRVAELRHG